MEKEDVSSPVRKRLKGIDGFPVSFEDIQPDLYHLALIKKEVLGLVGFIYTSQLSQTLKYLRKVEFEPESSSPEIPEVSDKFLQSNYQYQKQQYEDLSRKWDKHNLLTQIIKQKESCNISKMVDNI